MSVFLSRLSCFTLLSATSFASRPEPDEVHIPTNGHFVKKVSLGSHRGQRGHRHRSSHSKRGGVDDGAVYGPIHQATSDMPEYMPREDHEWYRHEDIAPELGHIERKRHAVLEHQKSEELRLQWEQAKRDFYASKDLGLHGELARDTWYDYLPYLFTRVLLVALIIYTFSKGPLTKQIQDRNEKAMAQRHQEHESLKKAGAATGEATPADPAGEAERELGEERAADERVVDECLGQAMEDRLCEVERWLKHSVEAVPVALGAPPIPAATDASLAAATSEGPGPSAGEEPEKRHYQRRRAEQAPSAAPPPLTAPVPVDDLAPVSTPSQETSVAEEAEIAEG